MTFPNPIVIATAHQKNIREMREKIQADAGCIRQLLVGRSVRRRGMTDVYKVTETRMNLSGVVEIRGKFKGAGRTKHIGTVPELELVEP